MNYPEQIRFAERKILAAKFEFFRLFHSAKVGIVVRDLAHPINNLQEFFFGALRSAHSKPRQKLDDFVNEAFRDCDNRMADYVPEDSSVWAAARAALWSRQELSCDKCVRSSNASICLGNEFEDRHALSISGHCILAFKHLFESASFIANAFYEENSTGFRRVRKPSIIFSTKDMDFGASLPVELAVDGGTHQHGSAICVQLKICVKKFTLEDFVRSLYVLAHEVAVHALSALGRPLHKRELSADLEAFAEGWMDYVVVLMIERALRGGATPQNFHPPLPFSHAIFAEECRSLHEARVNKYIRWYEDVKQGSVVEARSRGKRAAVIFFDRLSKLQPLTGESNAGSATEKLCYAFSIDVNISSLGLKERGKIVDVVLYTLSVEWFNIPQFTSEDAPLPRLLYETGSSRMDQYLREYIENGDTTALMERLLRFEVDYSPFDESGQN